VKLVWDKNGEFHDRVYTSSGLRGVYRISLERSADRWIIYVDNEKRVGNIYYVKNAQKIIDDFEFEGHFALKKLRPRPDGQVPVILSSLPVKNEETKAFADAVQCGSSQVLHFAPEPRKIFEPKPEVLAAKLHSLVTRLGVMPEKAGTPWLPWQSGVYALVDCIFSSQSNYNSVVLPLLRRLSARPNLHDQPSLRFTTFLDDIDNIGKDKFEQYAIQVLTRNKIAGRLKVEICYECAIFFARHKLETMADLQALGATLEPLILNNLQSRIHGVGPALSHYLLTLFGNEDHVKLDTMINRFWARMEDWCPRASSEHDYQIVLGVFRDAASRMGSTPARLDNAIWRYESALASGSSH